MTTTAPSACGRNCPCRIAHYDDGVRNERQAMVLMVELSRKKCTCGHAGDPLESVHAEGCDYKLWAKE